MRLGIDTPDRLGRIQRRIRCAFLANPESLLKTTELVRWAYPRLTAPPSKWHRWAVQRAARKVARQVKSGGRGRGRCAVYGNLKSQ